MRLVPSTLFVSVVRCGSTVYDQASDVTPQRCAFWLCIGVHVHISASYIKPMYGFVMYDGGRTTEDGTFRRSSSVVRPIRKELWLSLIHI